MSNYPNQLRVHRMEYWNGNVLDTMVMIMRMEFMLWYACLSSLRRREFCIECNLGFFSKSCKNSA